jgi:hypothetical protein
MRLIRSQIGSEDFWKDRFTKNKKNKVLPVSGNIWDPGSWIPEDVGIFNNALKALDFGLGESLNVKP